MGLINRTIAVLLRGVAHLFLAGEVRSLHMALRDLSTGHGAMVVETLPSILCQALVAAEDHRFYSHSGLDLVAVARAIWQRVLRGRIQGASTVEQQLTRTIRGRYERTLSRKLSEVLLASTVGEAFSKPHILRIYLTVAHFGWRMQGASRACAILGLDLTSLAPPQAASLVARLKYPEPPEPDPVWEARVRRRGHHILCLVSNGRGKLPGSFIGAKLDATISALDKG